MVTIERLFDLFEIRYGVLCWRVSRSRNKAGARAGSQRNGKYLQVGVDGRYLLVHRVVWAMTHGTWPDGDIDHVNRNCADNRPENLRIATRSQNQWNKGACKNNKLGVKGVRKVGDRFRSTIQANGVEHHLGYFGTLVEAVKAHDAAAKRLHGKFAQAWAVENDVRLGA